MGAETRKKLLLERTREGEFRSTSTRTTATVRPSALVLKPRDNLPTSLPRSQWNGALEPQKSVAAGHKIRHGQRGNNDGRTNERTTEFPPLAPRAKSLPRASSFSEAAQKPPSFLPSFPLPAKLPSL